MCRSGKKLVLCLFLSLVSPCEGQLTIFASPSLAERFATQGAQVDLDSGHVRLAGSTAVLGWPRYGDICSGPLRFYDVMTNCTLSRSVPTAVNPWIAVLRLGRSHGCPSLAVVLRMVGGDDAGALCGAVLLEAGDMPELAPGDTPGTFVPVLRRPAAATALAAAMEEAQAEGLASLRGELHWGQPVFIESLPNKLLPIEFWLNPASASRARLRAAAVALRPLRQHLAWQIHWPVSWRAETKNDEFCIRGSALSDFHAGGFVCMASGNASGSAPALLEEAAHLRCVQEADITQEMRWEYLERFLACEESDGEAVCARRLHAFGALGCGPGNFTAFILTEASKPRPWPMGLRGESPDFAVRIAGWAFGGMPEADAVFEAVCAVLQLPGPTQKPSACGEVWHWRAPGFFLQRVPVWPHSFVSLLLSFLLPLCCSPLKRTLLRLLQCCRCCRKHAKD
ncbi:unnamed protein product [Symbiodinium natans]|uniref:Uncharacterized protein n=1 Tax=Symbiodinium natans TaxID=878477 RepID=A0A812IC05_9DINO|nr:unnamed protein product [Symbiodinium natans]